MQLGRRTDAIILKHNFFFPRKRRFYLSFIKTVKSDIGIEQIVVRELTKRINQNGTKRDATDVSNA